MDLSNLRPAEGSKQVITSEEAVDMVPGKRQNSW